jgi:hypothetical protein
MDMSYSYYSPRRSGRGKPGIALRLLLSDVHKLALCI